MIVDESTGATSRRSKKAGMSPFKSRCRSTEWYDWKHHGGRVTISNATNKPGKGRPLSGGPTSQSLAFQVHERDVENLRDRYHRTYPSPTSNDIGMSTGRITLPSHTTLDGKRRELVGSNRIVCQILAPDAATPNDLGPRMFLGLPGCCQ